MLLADYPKPKNLSKRGMHWSASSYPEEGHWQDNLAWCADMGIGFIKFVEDGGGSGINVYRECWHKHGIIPVVRYYIGAYGKCGQREADAIKRTADVLGFRTYFELWNELDLPIEWNNDRPANWQEIMINNYTQNAQKVWDAGGLLGTPALASGCLTQTRIDEQGHVLEPIKYNWIKNCVDGVGGPQAAMDLGIWLSDHNYTINHPIDYPYDPVNQSGRPLTEDEYEAVPLWAWDNRSMESINAQRAKDKNPGDTIWDDDTCFRGFEIYLKYSKEAGLDCPLITTEGGPTQTRGDDGRYAKVTEDIMLAWLPQMYQVIGATPQYFGHCHWLLYNTTNGWEADRWRWGSQSYERVMAMMKSTPIGTWGEKFGSEPPTPVYDIPIRVKRSTGAVEVLELETYLTGVLPAEMPALWPDEALKAQAIAARSYALWRIENPRDEATYDLYDDARDQVYSPSMIHPNSTAMVEATAGVYIVQDTPAQYISRCGRVDCPLCQGNNGYQNGHWLGRMCQYGSQFMADRGDDYRDILELYYGDIELSTDEPDEGDTMDSTIVCDLTDANKYGVTIKPAQVTAGQGYWQVQSFKDLVANDGRHNFYCDVLKDGIRQYGTVIQASWPPGGPAPVTFKIEKPLTEPGGNMAINKHDYLTFAILGSDPCEQICNVNTNFVGDPSAGSSLYHWSFEGIWVWAIAGGEPEPPEPPTEGDFTEQDRDDLEAAVRFCDGIIADATSLKGKLTGVLERHTG